MRGSGIPAGHTVWVAGQPVPVDAQGDFVAEEILPTGPHTVEVAVLDEEGNGELFLRDLELRKRPLLRGHRRPDRVRGPHQRPGRAAAGREHAFGRRLVVYGRLAFFGTGKFGEGWRLTASADTREGPVEDLFSNFLDKAPDALFRRIDPDYHYPTFGDDGTVEEMAPTHGQVLRQAER